MAAQYSKFVFTFLRNRSYPDIILDALPTCFKKE